MLKDFLCKTVMDLTTFLAIWGAGLATAVALWDGYKWARHGRAELKIGVTGGMVSTDSTDKRFIHGD
jgi:hypothetical protein